MNLFIGIGRIRDAFSNSKALRFSLAIQQGEKMCYIPCLIFNPSEEAKKLIDKLLSTEQLVWLQGRITSYEFEYQSKTIRKTEVLAYARSIKIIE